MMNFLYMLSIDNGEICFSYFIYLQYHHDIFIAFYCIQDTSYHKEYIERSFGMSCFVGGGDHFAENIFEDVILTENVEF